MEKVVSPSRSGTSITPSVLVVVLRYGAPDKTTLKSMPFPGVGQAASISLCVRSAPGLQSRATRVMPGTTSCRDESPVGVLVTLYTQHSTSWPGSVSKVALPPAMAGSMTSVGPDWIDTPHE